MKTAVMYGAGNIGRGFIGQLFSLSGYKTQFIDINMAVIDRLNADGSYPHYTTRGERYEKTLIENVCGIDGKDLDAVADAIAGASVMATAVGVNVLKFIARPIALGLSRRLQAGGVPLNILICENKIGSDEYLRGLVYEHLNDEEKAWALQSVGFVEASIGRMVPAVPAELASENPLAVCAEEYCTLQVDRDAFRGGIPPIVHLQPFSPFVFFIERKLFLHNMTHAMTSYLGSLCGDRFVWQSALRPDVKLLTFFAAQESALALSREHGVEIGELLDNVLDLLYRFENRLLGDTIARVGRDTQRKLSSGDRLVGAYNLCKKQGVRPAAIALGIAAALYFEGEDDASSVEIASYTRENGVAPALSRYAGLTDPADVILIEEFYRMLRDRSLTEIITAVEMKKR